MSLSSYGTQNALSYQLFNNTSKELLLRNNGGMNNIISACPKSGYNNTIVLRVTLTVHNVHNVLFDLEGMTNALDREIATEFITQLNARKKNDFVYLEINDTICMTHTVTLGQRHASGLKNEIKSDLLNFTLSQEVNKYKDRFVGKTATAITQEIKNDLTEEESENLIVCMRVNDPLSIVNNLWTTAGGEAVLIPKTTNEDEPAGLYIVKGRNAYSRGSEYHDISKCSKEFLNALGVYHSKHEADIGGNSKLLHDLTSKVSEMKKSTEKAQRELNTAEVKATTLNNRLEHAKMVQLFDKERAKFKEDISKSANTGSGWGDAFKSAGGFLSTLFSIFKLLPI
ncbi:hypothetical protein KPN8_18 [Klebsiella phage KPN8]|nr:hypothetical protein KPN8_18 [Klebsiella phage KPN8]